MPWNLYNYRNNINKSGARITIGKRIMTDVSAVNMSKVSKGLGSRMVHHRTAHSSNSFSCETSSVALSWALTRGKRLLETAFETKIQQI